MIIPTVFSHNLTEFTERFNKVISLSNNIHIDFMDGSFVKGVSVEPENIPDLTAYNKHFSAHLMVRKPESYVKALTDIGFEEIIVHIESCETEHAIHELLGYITHQGAVPVLAKNPETPVQALYPFLHEVGGIMFMGIHPGKERQTFIESVYADIEELRAHDPTIFIQVDGGVTPDIARHLARIGVNAVNSGSFIGGAEHPQKRYDEILYSFTSGKEQLKKTTQHSLSELTKRAKKLRRHVIEMIHEAKSGHTGGSLGMADVFSALYFHALKHYPSNPTNPNRDYLFLSNGHICPILYASLAEAGYFPTKKLSTFRKINSKLQGHPHNLSLPGIENSGGPLGQGVSQAVGAAQALLADNKPNYVYCICGDGELDEGQVWEAALYAGSHKLHNFVQIIDRNNIQIDGNTSNVLGLEPLKEKFEAFNYHVIEIDGNNMQEITRALAKAHAQDKPTCIIAHTTPGKGVSFMEDDYHWHGRAPNDEEKEAALKELT